MLLAIYIAVALLSMYVSVVQCRRNPDTRKVAPETLGGVILLAAVFWPFTLGFSLTSAVFGFIGRAVQSQK
jgi:hypothetical protein